MKRFKLTFLIAIVLFSGGQSLFAKTDLSKEEQRNEIRAKIEESKFTINVNRANPLGGRSINLTSPYSLEIKGDSVISYLPYFGRAYNVPYGGSSGLKFEENMTEYSLNFDNKGTATIKFRVRTSDDYYRFQVQIFSNGNASIQVTPVNKQSISFYGEVNQREKKDN